MAVLILSAAIALAPAAVHRHGSCDGTGESSAGVTWQSARAFSPALEGLDASDLSRRVENAMLAGRIDRFLETRNSPLAGMGKVFIQAQERTGVSASLLVALTLAESSCATAGSLSITNHNAWGMKGPQPALGIPAENGYCLWSDWPSAIDGAADFIVHYWGSARTGHDLRGYARQSGPGSSWLTKVEGTRVQIACR
ncbi:MAG: glucosaminidase domain-containing protein [Actinobacteria bacterium]|nr:glucosaminidase domain-containing protein [Actinomycetota bacterium]